MNFCIVSDDLAIGLSIERAFWYLVYKLFKHGLKLTELWYCYCFNVFIVKLSIVRLSL